jgi:hypothetical protein
MSNFLLYIKFIVFMVPMLKPMQLFDDVLLFALMIITLLSFVAIIVTFDLM